jgi:predicted transcriptional regulator
VHFREIKRELNLAMGELQYHLQVLEKSGHIASKRIGLYKRFYPSRIFGEMQKQILSILSQETPRNIVLYLLQNPGVSHGEIARFVKLSDPTISWHMQRLINNGLIEQKREGRIVRYYVKGPVEDVGRFLQSYYPAVWERWADRLAEVFLNLAIKQNAEKENA